MKIKRFVATDMRQAMREVREEQGPEAVILSTRRVPDGIEVIAALDYDEALVREAMRQGNPASPPAAPPAMPASADAPPPSRLAAALAARQAQVKTPAPLPATPAPARPLSAAAARGSAAVPAQVQALMERSSQDTAQLRNELGDLRGLLEGQLASLAWNDLSRRQPLRARVLRELSRLGIEADVARALVAELPEQISADQARYLPLGLLSRSLGVSGRSLCGDERGVVALVGPTGVGKTTTIAKLAARAVMRHGAAQVALVSTDHYRIGAAAQLEHYGRLLGVQVYPAYDAKTLRKVLGMLTGRYAVLVDTAGMAATDPRLAQQLELFAGAGTLRACLVLAANAQAVAQEAALAAYQPLRPQACILTKLDEAPSLGSALSVLIRHKLALDYTTDGQRVPEDIAMADARALVCRAAQSLKADAPDDSVMAERFGLAMAGT